MKNYLIVTGLVSFCLVSASCDRVANQTSDGFMLWAAEESYPLMEDRNSYNEENLTRFMETLDNDNQDEVVMNINEGEINQLIESVENDCRDDGTTGNKEGKPQQSKKSASSNKENREKKNINHHVNDWGSSNLEENKE